MDESKKISILMGIYNCAATLAEAIDSIISQTYTNWQKIILMISQKSTKKWILIDLWL